MSARETEGQVFAKTIAFFKVLRVQKEGEVLSSSEQTGNEKCFQRGV